MRRWLVVALAVVAGLGLVVAKAMAGDACPPTPGCPLC